jgi:hypothetical protein
MSTEQCRYYKQILKKLTYFHVRNNVKMSIENQIYDFKSASKENLMLDLKKGKPMISAFTKRNGLCFATSCTLKYIKSMKNTGKYYLILELQQSKYDLPTTELKVSSIGTISRFPAGFFNLVNNPAFNRAINKKIQTLTMFSSLNFGKIIGPSSNMDELRSIHGILKIMKDKRADKLSDMIENYGLMNTALKYKDKHLEFKLIKRFRVKGGKKNRIHDQSPKN